MNYIISDIHGQFDMFMKMMDKINFNSNDKLYILGDAMDRGPKSAECMEYIMEHKNIEYLIGNHDLMFLNSCNVFFEYIKEEKCPINCRYIYKISSYEHKFVTYNSICDWLHNGGKDTLLSFEKYGSDFLQKVYNYILNCSTGKKITLNGVNYYLAHSKYIKRKMKKDYLTVNFNKRLNKIDFGIPKDVFYYSDLSDIEYYLSYSPKINEKSTENIRKIIKNISEIHQNVWYRPNWNESKYMRKGVYIFGHTMTKKYVGECKPYFEINGIYSSENEFLQKKPKNNALINIDTGCALISLDVQNMYLEKYAPRMTCMCLDNLTFNYVFPNKKED